MGEHACVGTGVGSHDLPYGATENYTSEFEEMYLGDNFGALSEPDTPNPLVSIDGVEVEKPKTKWSRA